MLKGFREFALRGNFIDLAVAVVVGAAIAALIGAISEGLVLPIVGIFLGGSFSDLATEFDPRRFDWIGSPELSNRVCVAKAGAPVHQGTADVLINAGPGAVKAIVARAGDAKGTLSKLIQAVEQA